MARDGNIPVQTHLSENPSEVEWVRALAPWSRNYLDGYRKMGLLDTKAVLAHAVWPGEEELDMLPSLDSWIAHSPSSNTNLSSGIAPVRAYMDSGVKVGLATDIAGGSSLSMMRMITDAIGASKLRWRLVDSSLKPLGFSEAFYLATKGGGSFFGHMGSFEPGYAADILVLEDSSIATPIHDELSAEERLEYYAYRTPEKLPIAKFVDGRRII